MTKINARATKAIEVLKQGGRFEVFEGRDYYGRPASVVRLVDADKRVVKGVSQSTLVDLVNADMIAFMGSDESVKADLEKYRGFRNDFYVLK